MNVTMVFVLRRQSLTFLGIGYGEGVKLLEQQWIQSPDLYFDHLFLVSTLLLRFIVRHFP